MDNSQMCCTLSLAKQFKHVPYKTRPDQSVGTLKLYLRFRPRILSLVFPRIWVAAISCMLPQEKEQT